MKRKIIVLGIALSLFIGYIVFSKLKNSNSSQTTYIGFQLVDSVSGYGFVVFPENDTVPYYKVDSLNEIIPAEDIHKYLTYKKERFMRYDGLNGRTTYIYQKNKSTGVVHLSHLIPHELQKGNYGLSVNRDTLAIGDTLSLTFVALGDSPHEVFIRQNETYHPLKLQNADERGSGQYDYVCANKGLQKLHFRVQKNAIVRERNYDFSFTFLVK